MDRFITQSRYVAERIRRVYGRGASVVHPPVDVARFAAVNPRDEGYFLIVSRFEAYKRIDLAIRACRLAGVPLRIVGAGVDGPRLRQIAAGTDGPGASAVEFLGPVPDAAVGPLLAGCRAFLHPGAEDFGLTAVEAQAAGRPVIAYTAGGALETVIPGLTGAFFDRPEAEALAETIAAFRAGDYDPATARRRRRPLRPCGVPAPPARDGRGAGARCAGGRCGCGCGCGGGKGVNRRV